MCHGLIANSAARLRVKYPAAVTELEKAEAALQSIESTSQPNLVDEWKTQEEEAQANRNRNVSSMDIYDLKISKGKYLFPSIRHAENQYPR